jgi:tRNA threonylcarbamoyladenosine biosynthesis protein TsaE
MKPRLPTSLLDRYDIVLSLARTEAEKLAMQLRGGEILALIGPLGAGKTTFTQALGQALGVKEKILSPTFIVMQEFPTKLKSPSNQPVTLIHLDLYRTEKFKEIETLGLTQAWGQPNTITIIEWADKIRSYLPKNTIYIHLTRDLH